MSDTKRRQAKRQAELERVQDAQKTHQGVGTHPITPPPNLTARWVNEIYGKDGFGFDVPLRPITLRLAERAAQWGADQELEAVIEWMKGEDGNAIPPLLAARRPQLPPETIEVDGHTYRLVK